MNREDKRGIFFGVVGVLTLIVAIIGASLAWFSIEANSTKDAVTVQAATVKIVYKEGDLINVTDIIPSARTIAFETYRRYLNEETYNVDVEGTSTPVKYEKCKDDHGRTVCGVYEFSVENNGEDPVTVTAKIVPTALEASEKQFTNLKWVLYDISTVTDVKTDFGTEVATGTVGYSDFSIIESAREVTNGKTSNYRLFIWLDEINGPQNEEQGATFKGTVYVNIPELGDNITGDASDTLKD